VIVVGRKDVLSREKQPFQLFPLRYVPVVTNCPFKSFEPFQPSNLRLIRSQPSNLRLISLRLTLADNRCASFKSFGTRGNAPCFQNAENVGMSKISTGVSPGDRLRILPFFSVSTHPAQSLRPTLSLCNAIRFPYLLKIQCPWLSEAASS
jgi:hypothetical protein